MRILLMLLCVAIIIPCHSQTKTDSLWRVWKNPAAADTLRLQALSAIIKNNYLHSSPDSAFILSQWLYDFAMKKNLEKYSAQALHTQARVRSIKGDYTQALNYYNTSLKIFEAISDTVGITSCLNNMGFLYIDQGNVIKATDIFFRCLKLRERTKDKKGQAGSLINIGELYMREHDFPKALEYYNRSLVIAKEINNQRMVGVTLTSIGIVYKEKGDTMQAADYYRQAIAVLKPLGDKDNLARTYYSMSSLLEAEQKYEEGIRYQQMSLELRTEIGDSIGMMKSLYGIGILYDDMHQPVQAISYGERALAIAYKQNNPRVNRNIGELLFRLYEQQGDYKKALAMHKFYIAARDSMHNDDMKKATYKEQLKYDYEKKELISKAENDAKLNSLQLVAERNNMRKNTWLIISIGISVLLISGGFFLVYSFKQKNIIAVQKENLLKQKLLVSQLNPHFIFNSLNAVQNFVMKQDTLEAGNFLAQLAVLMRQILDFSRKNYVTIEEECAFLINYFELQQLRFNNKFEYRIVIDEHIDRENISIPPMLAQPFIENAIEHGIFYKKEKGIIELRITEEDGHLFYEIEDDGVGIMAAELQKKSSGHSYESLATLITEERLYTHFSKSKNHINHIGITDKLSPNHGVKVRFEIPSQNKSAYA